MTEWRDIATAPKDGTEILAYEAGDFSIVKWARVNRSMGWQCMGDGCSAVEYMDDFGTGYLQAYPSHWMPLPEAPQ